MAISFTGKGQGIAITAYAAGHMAGGTIWKIAKETDDIVYAVDYNHGKERHLDGTMLSSLTRCVLCRRSTQHLPINVLCCVVPINVLCCVV